MLLNENTLLRDYKIICKIGEGGMGSVYLAEDTMLDRKVALKVLNPLLTEDPHFIDRFRQEAKVQAGLIHPNIVTLYNFFMEENNYYMVMEYAAGITLKEFIKKTGPIPEERALRILKQILEGLGYAHAKRIIHRDIKPGNIIIDIHDNVKIMDFGLARILSDKGMTKTGAKMGTVYYMSPEQIRAEKDIDQRTDIYSLGITFYEMLSGRIPFNTAIESDFVIMNQIINEKIRDPRQYYPFISNEMVDIIYHAVDKDKRTRISSASTFLNEINKAKEKITLPAQREKFILPKQSDIIVAEENIKPLEVESLPLKKPLINSQKTNNENNKVRLKKRKIFYVFVIMVIIMFASLLTLINSFKTKNIYLDESKNKIVEQDVSKNNTIVSEKNPFRNSISNDEDKSIKDELDSWIKSTMEKSSSIGEYYSKNLEYYYTWGKTTRQKVVDDKEDYFKKWDKINLSISDVQITDKGFMDNIGYVFEVIYNKNFEVENFTSKKRMSGEVKSKLGLVSDHGGYLIFGEVDLLTIHLEEE